MSDDRPPIAIARAEGVEAVYRGGPYADVIMPTKMNPLPHAVAVLDMGEDNRTPTSELPRLLREWLKEDYAAYWENA